MFSISSLVLIIAVIAAVLILVLLLILVFRKKKAGRVKNDFIPTAPMNTQGQNFSNTTNKISFCPNCGSNVANDGNFCRSCGQNLTKK